MTQKTVAYYMNLPYTIELQRDPEDAWFVQVKELPGCMSQGDTAEEALAMIQEAMLLWLEIALEDDLPIPEPRLDDDYSGKFVVRVPRSLHKQLVEAADEDGVSLNQYINVALAREVGHPSYHPRRQTAPNMGLLQQSLYVEPTRAASVLREKDVPLDQPGASQQDQTEPGPPG